MGGRIMAKETKGDVGIFFVQDMSRRLMKEFRAVCYLQGYSVRKVLSDLLRDHIRNYVRTQDLCPGQFGLDASNWKEEE